MIKYLVKRPWHGVSKGDIIETDKLHPALLPNVEVLIEQDEGLEEPAKEELKPETETPETPEAEEAAVTEEPKLEVATPKAKTKGK